MSGDNLTQKTKIKDPFTRSKKIYRIGRSLKICGTVHNRHGRSLISVYLRLSLLRLLEVVYNSLYTIYCFTFSSGACVYLSKDKQAQENKYRTKHATIVCRDIRQLPDCTNCNGVIKGYGKMLKLKMLKEIFKNIFKECA